MAVPRSGFRNASVSAHTAVLNWIRPSLRSHVQPNPRLERTGTAPGRPDRATVGAGRSTAARCEMAEEPIVEYQPSLWDTPWLRRQVETHLVFGLFVRRLN